MEEVRVYEHGKAPGEEESLLSIRFEQWSLCVPASEHASWCPDPLCVMKSRSNPQFSSRIDAGPLVKEWRTILKNKIIYFNKKYFMQKNIKNITIGVRFVRTFHLPEIAGKITDDVLRNTKSPFGEKFFEYVARDGEGGRILHQGETSNTRLVINKDDIVFSLDIKNFEEDFEKIKEVYLPYIVEQIISANQLSRVQRLGVIFRHSLENSSFSNETVKSVTSDKIDHPNDLIIRFSKKLGTMEAQAIQGKKDYKNAIFTLEYDNKNLFIDIDYQQYFHPIKEDVRDSKPYDFLDSAKLYIEKQYEWLKTYQPENG